MSLFLRGFFYVFKIFSTFEIVGRSFNGLSHGVAIKINLFINLKIYQKWQIIYQVI